MPARVSERSIRAGGAAQISVHSNRLLDDRRPAHHLCGQHYANKSGASFTQELPVVEKIYTKFGVGIHNMTFSTMHTLETYYLNQVGRGLSPTPGIGPIYSAPLYLRRGQVISNFLCTLFRFVRPLLWTVGEKLAR